MIVLSLLGCYTILFFGFYCPYLFLEECDDMGCPVWNLLRSCPVYLLGVLGRQYFEVFGADTRNEDGQEGRKVRGYTESNQSW